MTAFNHRTDDYGVEVALVAALVARGVPTSLHSRAMPLEQRVLCALGQCPGVPPDRHVDTYPEPPEITEAKERQTNHDQRTGERDAMTEGVKA